MMDYMHQAMSDTAKILAKQKDDVISAAITHAIGAGWIMDDLVGRVELQPLPNGTEFLSVDGKQLILFYPLDFELNSTTCNAKIEYQRLY